MTTIQTRSHVGPDGLLRLTLPVDVTDTDLDVTVVVRPVITDSAETSEEHSREVVRRTAGKWQGEPLVRPDQGQFEKRDEWG